MERPEQDPEQDKRTLAAVALSILVLWVFSNFVFEPPPPLPPEAQDSPAVESASPAADPGSSSQSVATSAATDAPGVAATASSDAPVQLMPEPEPPSSPPAPRPVEIERSWAGVQSVWSNAGGAPTHLEIEAYQAAYEQKWIPTWLISGFGNGLKWEPFDIDCPQGGPVDIVHDPETNLLPVGIDETGIAGDTNRYLVKRRDPSALSFLTRRNGIEITKSYELPEDGYVVNYRVEFQNVSSRPEQVQPSFGVADRMEEGAGGYYGPQMEGWIEVDGEVDHYPADKLAKKDRVLEGAVSWLGVGDRYFLVALEPEGELQGIVRSGEISAELERYAVVLELPGFTLAPGELRSFSFRLWAGPKDLELLRESGMKAERSVDFGFFGLLALPILAFLKFLFGLIGNWGIAIIVLTVCIKALLFPLSQKSYKSMKDMQRLQPEINALKEKHKEDREAMNQEMMALWKEHGVNPMGGCLPMVIQMPIWFALYRVLWNSVELYQTPFLYFCDLSLRDPLGVFPLVLGVTMWAQQKFTPNTATDPTQQAIMKFMPVFFSVIMFTLPAGLVVYILVNNILSIGQQWLIHRRHGEPVRGTTTTEESDPKGGKQPGRKK